MSIAQIIQIEPKEFPHLATALDCDVSSVSFLYRNINFMYY